MDAREVEVTLLDRPLTVKEVTFLADEFYKFFQKQTGKGHVLTPFASYNRIFHTLNLANNCGHLDVFVSENKIVGFLMYDVSIPWWTDEPCLTEMAVFTVDPHFTGFGRIAVERLKEIASIYNCSFIQTASAICIDHKPIENLYMKKGKYHFTYPCFVYVLNKNDTNSND